MDAMIQELQAVLSGFLPSLLGAVLVLIIGAILARIIGSVVGAAISRVGIDRWFANNLGGGEGKVSQVAGKGVFWLLMIFVIIAVLQILGLTIATSPLDGLLSTIMTFLPRLAAAAILFAVAWVLATVVRKLLVKALTASKIDEKVGGAEGKSLPVSATFGEIAYWLIFLVFLPTILEALALDGLLEPVKGMMDTALGFVPNLITAGVILLVAWFVARLVYQVVRSLLVALGLEKVTEKAGLGDSLGEKGLSGVLAMVAQAFVIIPLVIAALDALQLDALSVPASNMLTIILAAIPSIFAAAVILGFAVLIGRFVSSLVSGLLAGIGFDALLGKIGLRLRDGAKAPSAIAGTVVMVLVVLFAAMEALNLLGFGAVAGIVESFIQFGGHVLMALIIIGIGLYLANLAAAAVKGSGAPNSGFLARVAHIAIVVLAGSMGLRELGVGDDIILLAFGLLVGALAVAAAVAFGLGGRDVAKTHLEKWTRGSGRVNPPSRPSV